MAFGSSRMGEYNAGSEPDGAQVRKPMERTSKATDRGVNVDSRVYFHPAAHRHVLEMRVGIEISR